MEMVGDYQSHISSKPFKNEDEEEDRISALPDCLIVQILSLLPSAKVAIRAGTLSKRWKSLSTLIPTLVFRHYDRQSISDFLSSVNETLTQRPHYKLIRFEISVVYNTRFEALINNWIRYAISCNVEQLDLKLYNSNPEEMCVLDDQIFMNSCFTDLKLDGFVFDPSGAIAWKRLRSLMIGRAKLDEILIENILLGCPVLETLFLDYCYGFRRLDITSKSVKKLVFSGYRDLVDFYLDFEDEFEINAPNILSLKIESILYLWKLSLLDVSSLVEAELNYMNLESWGPTRCAAADEMLKGFIQKLHHIKKLKIGANCAKVLFSLEAKGFPFPSNMEFPKLTPF